MRYLLFGGDVYYAQGGGNDLISCGPDLESLKIMAVNLGDNYGWWHIFDTHSQGIVEKSEQQAYIG